MNRCVLGLIFFIMSISLTVWAAESPRELLVVYTGDTLGHVEPCG